MIEMEMNQMKRKVLSLAMIAALCLTMLPTAGWAADAPVEYIDFDENGVQITEPRSCDQYSLVTKNDTAWNDSGENDGWYVVNGTVEIGSAGDDSAEDGSSDVDVQRVTVGGDVHLILTNNAKLTVNGGISVKAGNSLTIYAQPAEKDKTMGSLTVENVEVDNAGIGGDDEKDGGTITINGGSVTATGGLFGAGIGGGDNGSGGMIEINGGEIIATGGSYGAGIGGGSASSGGIITINGGTIATTGGNLGAGIGSLGAGGTIEINGGDITATGGDPGAGIGGGHNGSGGTIKINGGTVTAIGKDTGAGIGGGTVGAGGNIIINDGTIIATGGGLGAGIGGGNEGSGGEITINGGTVEATGGTTNGAGIGGGSGGIGGTITIGGGEITAKSNGPSAGIGSGAVANSGMTTINISGGSVTATGGSSNSSGGGAGIGSGGENGAGSSVGIMISGGTVIAQGGSPTAITVFPGGAGIGGGGYPAGSSTITIIGGTVTASGGKGADGIGNGGESQNGSSSTFSTGDAGNAVIYATAGDGTDTEAIVGSSSPTDWDAIVFTPGENGSAANSGTVYGDVSLANDLTIESDQSLEIPDGTSLEIPEKVMLKIEEGGTLTIHGELVVYGTLTGYSGDSSKIHQQSQSDTDWHTDATHHWHACAYENCTEHKFGEAAHSFTNGKCAVCDYVQPVSITEQPTDVSVTEGESATFSVAATGGGTLSFQWQQSTYNGSNWTNIDGATNASYTIEKTTLDMNGTKYRCVVKNDADSEATSNEVVLTVNEATEEPDPGTDPDEPSTDPDDPSTEPDDPAEEDPSDNPSTPVIPSEPDPEIEVTEPAHGDVEISPSKPEAGETVTITPTPDDGYEVEDVIVTDEDGECVPVRENPDGSWSYEQPKSDVTIEVIFGEVAPEPTVDVSEIFLDVDPDAWYKDAVQFVYDNGLMTGTSATEFAPDVTTTRDDREHSGAAGRHDGC